MAAFYDLNTYRLQGCLQQKQRVVKKVPSVDEIIDDEFVARRAMREGQFDDGLTIPIQFESLNPFGSRAASPPRRSRAGGSVASPSRRSPRLFFGAIIFGVECLAVTSALFIAAFIISAVSQ